MTLRQTADTAAPKAPGDPFRLRQLAPCIGAEITGIDVAAGLDSDTFIALRDAVHRYSVVVLPGQRLTPAQHLALVTRLGPLRESSYTRANRFSVPEQPELMVVSNIRENGQPIGLMDAGVMWHSDGTHMHHPDMYTVFYAIEVPERDGVPLGDTLFASVAEAYDALSDAMKARILPLRAVHSFEHHLDKKARLGTLKRPPMTAAQKAEVPDVEHPVVCVHPVTGRKCLYVTEGHTARISGLPASESDALLAELWAHIARPEFVYRHSWKAGDLVIWDDRSSQHLATFDYGDIPRRMHRGETEGPAPQAAFTVA